MHISQMLIQRQGISKPMEMEPLKYYGLLLLYLVCYLLHHCLHITQASQLRSYSLHTTIIIPVQNLARLQVFTFERFLYGLGIASFIS